MDFFKKNNVQPSTKEEKIAQESNDFNLLCPWLLQTQGGGRYLCSLVSLCGEVK